MDLGILGVAKCVLGRLDAAKRVWKRVWKLASFLDTYGNVYDHKRKIHN